MAFAGVDLVIQAYNAGGGFDKSAYDPQQRCLAAAGGAQNGDEFAVLDIQVNFLEGLGFVEAFCYLLYM